MGLCVYIPTNKKATMAMSSKAGRPHYAQVANPGGQRQQYEPIVRARQVEVPAQPTNSLVLPPHGFGDLEVPEMPAYVHSYSSRGNVHGGERTPVYQQARWGNRVGRGGMAAYLSQLEDDTFFEGYKTKKGNHGVFDATRWSPGYDWRGNFGVASNSELKNYAGIPTRGGSLRKGGPRRSDYMDRPNFWFEQTRPGISHGRYTQSSNNYAGLYQDKKQTPTITLDNDMLVLREMIEHNPWHISSHSAMQAKSAYDSEFGPPRDMGYKAYQDHMSDAFARSLNDPSKRVTIKEDSPYMINRP